MSVANTVWVPLAAALLGAAVGGAATLVAGVVVDRQRLRRETRVQIYDERIGEALTQMRHLHERSQRGMIDMTYHEVLDAVARVHRAAVIAGRADRRQIRRWQSAYHALLNMNLTPNARSTALEGQDQDRVLSEVATHAHTVITGLESYWKWLEKRIA